MLELSPLTQQLEANLQLCLQLQSVWTSAQHLGANTPGHKLVVVADVRDHIVHLLWCPSVREAKSKKGSLLLKLESLHPCCMPRLN